MAFSDDFGNVNSLLDQVSEFMQIIQGENEFPDQNFFDVRPSLKKIRIEGMYMNEAELFDLRRSLETIREIVLFLQKEDDDSEDGDNKNNPYPNLRELAEDIMVFPQLTAKINNILDKFGK